MATHQPPAEAPMASEPAPPPAAALQMTQPSPNQAMNPRQAHAQDDAGEERGRLRGGGEACPGRFCFIIPCPIPCNCCIIPCPC